GAPNWAKVEVTVWHIEVAQARAGGCGCAGGVEVTAGAAGGADDVAGALLALPPQPATMSPAARTATASGRRSVAPDETFIVSSPRTRRTRIGSGVTFAGQSDVDTFSFPVDGPANPTPASGLVVG